MTDIFSILGQAAAPRNSLAGTSIEDLENHLRGLLESKVSPLKSERLSFTYEITSSARFTVSLSQSENDVLEGLGGIDPGLGGARSSEAPDDAQLARVIPANDTIMNQPQDNPILQRVVAKHIIASVGACDGSSWAVREVSRGPQGWSFTYICKDSMQSWRRQTGKNVQSVVGDYSEKERDPVASSRPAFDCSGSVVISFSRGSRNITIKYKHMPFHKTVAELYDHFAPPPPPEPLVTATPKSAKTSRKRDGPKGTGEGSTRKKSRKKSGVGASNEEGAAEATAGDESIVIDGDASQPDGTPQGKPKRKRQYKRKNKDAAGQQEGSTQAAEGGSGDAAAQLDSIVKVDAEEAARRRQKATEILTNAGVDPGTLSTDQFNIFANQSPALQQESLAMLVEYGAERLRIVHPNKDSSATNTAQDGTAEAESTSTAQASVANESQAATPTESANAPAPRQKRPRVSRGSCTNCRGQKGVKCGREKPACQNCVDAGVDCSYPLQQSRPKKAKSDAEVVDDVDDTTMMDAHQDGDTTQMSVGDATMNTMDLPTTTDELRPDPAMDPNRPPQFDGADESPDEAPAQQQDHDIADPIPRHTYPPPEPPQPEPQPELYQEPIATPRPQSRSKSRGSRRSPPAGRQSMGSNELPPVPVPRSPETPSWGTVNPSSLAASQSQTRQPAILQSPPAGFSPQNESDESARIGYEPYSNHPGTGNQPYNSYDNFNRPNSTNMRMPTTSAQTDTSGYATSSSMSASSVPNSRWPSQTSSTPAPSSHTPLTNQTHNTQAQFNRNMNQTTSNNNPYTQTSSNSYAQKPQTQAPPYNPQQNPARAAQQQRPQQQHHQQNWYGLNPGSGGGGGGGDYRRGGAYVSGSYAQHGGMGIGGYGGDGDLIDLLGSVHPRS